MSLKGTAQATARREHDLEKQAKRVILTDPFGGIFTQGNFTVMFEESSEGVYIGSAQIGTAGSSSAWQIKKITDNGIYWANSTDAFVNKWTERKNYEYS